MKIAIHQVSNSHWPLIDLRTTNISTLPAEKYSIHTEYTFHKTSFFSLGSQHLPVVGHQIMRIQQLASSVVAANCGLLCPRQEQKAEGYPGSNQMQITAAAHSSTCYKDPPPNHGGSQDEVRACYSPSKLQDSHWIPL